MGKMTKEQTNDYNDLIAIQKIAEWIKTKKRDELERLDIREKVLKVVYEDCMIIEQKKDLHIEFIDEYEKKVKDKNDDKVNILIKTAFGKSYAKSLKYDYDDSLISSYIFCKTIDIPKEEKWQISSNGGYEYKICKGESFYFRGDTMNSWSRTLNEYMRLFGNRYLTDYNGRKIPKNYKSWENYLSRPEHYKSKIPAYISNFMKAVYTIGNFALVPGPGGSVSFNNNRNSKFMDYWDLTLLAIYGYYMGEIEGEWICSLEKEPEAKKVLKNWLNKSKEPKDQNGWNNFVKVNFMQPFVRKLGNDQYGAPYELWDYHFKDKGLPKEEWQFEQFFVNAKVRILERGKLIAQALVKAED